MKSFHEQLALRNNFDFLPTLSYFTCWSSWAHDLSDRECIGKMTRRGHSNFAWNIDKNQDRGSNGDVEGCVVECKLCRQYLSVKWMMNRNKCDTTEMLFSAHQSQVLLPSNL